MKLDQLTLAQTEWLNRECADASRKFGRIRQRLQSRGFAKDEPIYDQLDRACEALLQASAETHRRIAQLRPRGNASR